jgi:hypothetical protein
LTSATVHSGRAARGGGKPASASRAATARATSSLRASFIPRLGRSLAPAEEKRSYVTPAVAARRRVRAAARRAASTVLRRSMAMVIGPTPPGTGVMAEATSRTASNSTSPRSA